MAPRGVMMFGGDVHSCTRIGEAADAAGLDVWTSEFYDRTATVTMASLALRTENCRIGSSIHWGIGRTPLTTVAEARDLDLLSNGRTVIGLGNGTKKMMADWHGVADTSSPAIRMEELVTVIRKLFKLHEGRVRHDGRFYHVDLQPTADVVAPLRPEIPLYVAGVQERMIESAGRVGDGVLLHPIHGTKFIDDVARPAVERGKHKTGRSSATVEIVAAPICVIHEDREVARTEAAGQIAFYAAPKTYAAVHEVNGFGREAEIIRGHFAAGDHDAMRAAVTDDMIDALCCAGTPDEVRDGLRRFESVADHVLLYSPSYGLTRERIEENTNALIAHCGS